MSENLTQRKRGASIQQVIHDIETDKTHHLTGSFRPQTPESSAASTPNGSHMIKPVRIEDSDFYSSKGMWNDIKTLRWMRVPSSAFKLLVVPIILYLVWAAILPNSTNPFAPLLFISHPLPDSPQDDPLYRKGWLDIAFIAYHIIVFSFIRQFTLFKIIHPTARLLGIKKGHKLERFGEQGYAMLYYGTMGVWGAYVMSTLPTWWYQTKYFWIDYPHWQMSAVLKRFYLMHFSYWLQQLVILALKLEKPRKDYNELVVHHLVTLWLIGWSYGINLTLIGNSIFVSMDIPDTFLAFSKLCNYLGLHRTKIVAFVVFLFVWTYFRHFLNFVILYSVWTEFDLIPASEKFFRPLEGLWMTWWMKYQIFTPILLLQLLNLFWYFFMLRILYRALSQPADQVDDDRSDGEDDDDDEKDD